VQSKTVRTTCHQEREERTSPVGKCCRVAEGDQRLFQRSAGCASGERTTGITFRCRLTVIRGCSNVYDSTPPSPRGSMSPGSSSEDCQTRRMGLNLPAHRPGRPSTSPKCQPRHFFSLLLVGGYYAGEGSLRSDLLFGEAHRHFEVKSINV
jgi:hypothetical protein